MKHVGICIESINTLIGIAHGADRLVNLVLDGEPYAEVIRELILDLNSYDNVSISDEEAADLVSCDFVRAELRDGVIWLYKAEEAEEATCPAKT